MISASEIFPNYFENSLILKNNLSFMIQEGINCVAPTFMPIIASMEPMVSQLMVPSSVEKASKHFFKTITCPESRPILACNLMGLFGCVDFLTISEADSSSSVKSFVPITS